MRAPHLVRGRVRLRVRVRVRVRARVGVGVGVRSRSRSRSRSSCAHRTDGLMLGLGVGWVRVRRRTDGSMLVP